jgi:glutamate 5-kinase
MPNLLVIKIGTNVITDDAGKLSPAALEELVEQIMTLKKRGVQIILVSSGAVAAGQDAVHPKGKMEDVTRRQVLAATGQVRLMQAYTELFSTFDQLCAQVLTIKEDFRTRRHYLNIKNGLEGLLAENVIPIVNENDVVSMHELMFTDNDELAGLIASMMNAEKLILLTNVNGVFEGCALNENAPIIPVIEPGSNVWAACINEEKSQFGRGGMLTKCKIASKLSSMGITAHIANGKTEGVLLKIVDGEQIGTTFQAKKRTTSAKRWVGTCEGQEKGTVYINAGAAAALMKKEDANSLLPIGVVSIEGDFEKGDLVKICTEDGADLGMGMVQIDSETAEKQIGKKGEKALVHYDYLFLY